MSDEANGAKSGVPVCPHCGKVADDGVVVRYEGAKERLGGREYVIPSLSTKQVRSYWKKLLSLNEGVTDETFADKVHDAVVIIHAALSRNYPDLTFDEVDDFVDLANFRRLVGIVSASSKLNASGPQPAAVEEVAK